MNYCYISERLDMTSEEVCDLFSALDGDYYDLAERTISDGRSHSSVRIKYYCDEELEKVPDELAEKWWDEYTNKVTQLSWQALKDYLAKPHKLVGVTHAAFLIDIAARNCISICQELLEVIAAYKSKDKLLDYGFAMMKGFDRTKFYEIVNKPVLATLNIGYYKDAFVRA